MSSIYGIQASKLLESQPEFEKMNEAELSVDDDDFLDHLSDLSHDYQSDEGTDPFVEDNHLLNFAAEDEVVTGVKVLSLDEVPFDRDIR